MWAKASIPRFPSSLGKRGKPAGRQRRSSTYPQALFVNLPRRPITKALVLALLVVENEPAANASPGLAYRRIGVEVDLLVFEAAPQPLDKDVVHAATLAVHADHDLMGLQNAGEVLAGELATLVGIDDLGSAVAVERFLKRPTQKSAPSVFDSRHASTA